MLSIDANDVPRVFRIVVTVDGEQVANTTTYAAPNDGETLRFKILSAYAGEGISGDRITVDVHPA